MSKSKKQRQEEKKKQLQEQAQKQKNTTMESAAKTQTVPETGKTTEKRKEAVQDAGEIRMNFYSAMSMITTLVAAASAVIAMLLAGRGFYYILQWLYDENQTDITLLGENLELANFHPEIHTFMYISGVVLAVQVIFSLVATVLAINPKKKPQLLISVAMIVLSAAGIVFYCLARQQTAGIADMFARVQQSKQMNIYIAQLYVLIGNLVCVIVNLSAQIYGLKLYKKTGKTCS